MKYLNWNETKIVDFSDMKISEMYENGYVFTRLGRGVMQQTRSVRIRLDEFELSSENRRVLKKTDDLVLSMKPLPLNSYDFHLGKLAKDFYDTKFGRGIMSAMKVKEMLTDKEKSSFNCLLEYSLRSANVPAGYSICRSTTDILHYSYPFYDLVKSPKDMGLGMMIRAILYAKEHNMKYIYLGSLQRPSDTYKLQFNGLEWFDGEKWSTDLERVKKILATDSVR